MFDVLISISNGNILKSGGLIKIAPVSHSNLLDREARRAGAAPRPQRGGGTRHRLESVVGVDCHCAGELFSSGRGGS